MPFNIADLQKAKEALGQFRAGAVSPHHERYSFPFFNGSYFVYRKVDVMRLAAIAKSISNTPSYLDVGCGYGDFLAHVREFMYDLVFVGWMEPGQDFRDPVAHCSDVIVTTLDQGISLAAEFDGHGFDRVAWWRTPSWEDVNIEIMNRHYTKIPEARRAELHRMRGAHNLWYVYARPEVAGSVRAGLRTQLASEDASDRYDFESVLDERGFGYMEELSTLTKAKKLWEVMFD